MVLQGLNLRDFESEKIKMECWEMKKWRNLNGVCEKISDIYVG